MKAIIISDDETAIERFSIVLRSAGYDVIVYRWLVKALDNIEEIAPHLILVNTLDYPRHWKTLAQYAKSGIGGIIPQVILFTEKNFPVEEQKKAEELGIRGMFSSYDVDGLDKLRSILEKTNDIFSGTLNGTTSGLPIHSVPAASTGNAVLVPDISTDVDSDEDETDNGESDAGDQPCRQTEKHADGNHPEFEFIFTNPKTNAFVTGTVFSCSDQNMTFAPDYLPDKSLVKDDVLALATLKNGNKIEHVSAVVTKSGKNIEFYLQAL